MKSDDKVMKVGTAWISFDEYKLWEAYYEERKALFIKHMLWGEPWPVREIKEEDFVKLALVDGGRIIGVHTKTMVGYELIDDTPVVKVPLVETEYKVFDRWARMMDV